MTDLPPEAPVEPAGRGLLDRISIVWVIPAAALAIALGVAWHSYVERGPLLELTFETASGIKAGETELHYRDVTVGLVEKVGFTDNLDEVLVSVRLDKAVAPYVDRDADFWVVQPEVSARGVTGLSTVLSGVFIQGIWDDTPDGFVERHRGKSAAPLNREGRPGLRLRLRAASDAGLTEEAPILYRGIEVGRIGKAEVSRDGSTVEADAIVFAPHDRLISSSTRFWDSSGFSFSLGPGGARVDFSSVAALLSGGVTFQSVVSGGKRVEPDTRFEVYPDESTARASVFAAKDGPALTLTAYFAENVEGLSIDAPVMLGGLRIGRVTALNGTVDADRFGDDRVRLAATLAIQPARLGLEAPASTEDALDYLAGRVRDGLRARLATASILTRRLKVELIETAGTAPAELDRDADPNPVIPTTASDISDVSATAEGLYNRINDLPIEDLMQSAIDALNSVSTLAGSDEIRAVPGEVRALLGEARGIVGSDEMQALPGRIDGTVAAIETLARQLAEADAASRLTAALDAAAGAAETIDTAAAGLPDLVARLNAVADQAATLPLDELAGRISALLDSTDRLIDTDQARDLPTDLSAALRELAAMLAELREGGVVGNANATLASARSAADDISTAARDLPDLLARAQRVLGQASSTIEGYDASRGMGREIDTALREIQRAAQAVTALSRALERNPNSILFGR
ncbi:MlaD family protein [Rhodovulum sulfidophilum]|uniref:MlaD family protein n=1 Tax=Rhodovulum sulfidophilum TaxID=35806 RepID=UPI000950F616|nr:MlaD family protein [Rhodovulum sulfidophilum]NDK36607.1 MCE family protein [Rhodovulum sulfidophilum]OLS51126.1 paraquat-inducible protein B [Rhodovulum sulfidophilum]